jgi:hypothetical protein
MAFGKLTEENCRILQTVHECCLEWARRHGTSFDPKKYIIVHFTKARTKHNHSCPLILPTSTIHPSPSARVLGVILDKKLSWQPHLHHIKSMLATQTNVLSRLTASTWSASLWVLRLLYTTVIRPAITTSCPAWWAPPSMPFYRKGVGKELQRVEIAAAELSLGLQGHTNTKPPGRSGHTPSASALGWQAGPFSLEVCRVRDRRSGRRWHLEGQTVSQLHQNMTKMPKNAQKPADCQQSSPSHASNV